MTFTLLKGDVKYIPKETPPTCPTSSVAYSITTVRVKERMVQRPFHQPKPQMPNPSDLVPNFYHFLIQNPSLIQLPHASSQHSNTSRRPSRKEVDKDILQHIQNECIHVPR